MQRVLPYFVVAAFLAALAVAILPSFQTKLGLDLIGGLRGEYEIQATDSQTVTPEILAQTRTIIENRVNATGVTEPVVTTQGSNRISVELPGAVNETEVRDLVGTTGRLDFVGVPQEFDAQVIQGQKLPANMDPTPLFSGDQIAAARPGQEGTTGLPAVDLELKDEGSRLFDEYAASHLNQRFAIVLDGIVQSAPVLQASHFGGRAQITGSFTAKEVNDLVTVLKFGSLPLEIKEVGFLTVSPTLGQNFLLQTLLAGFIGVALVMVFMLVFYRLPGAVACLALLFYSLAVYGLFRAIPVTLTLAGIAAFVLSVGMAVDANILIFERTKEELRAGKTLSAAVEAGFNRAWNSILDSNVSSLITATILYYFGSSTIRGFALVLILGVLTSMFTAITLSRIMMRWVVRQPWARKASLYGVNEEEFLAATPRARTRDAAARV
ncbi:MAG: preprotein translocase subunit SecD [Chloroflexota bacterium]|jgi:protein-export membrane protein SecD|nr:preprotein translocase subunit SecD [Chloroflexota bacterium]